MCDSGTAVKTLTSVAIVATSTTERSTVSCARSAGTAVTAALTCSWWRRPPGRCLLCPQTTRCVSHDTFAHIFARCGLLWCALATVHRQRGVLRKAMHACSHLSQTCALLGDGSLVQDCKVAICVAAKRCNFVALLCTCGTQCLYEQPICSGKEGHMCIPTCCLHGPLQVKVAQQRCMHPASCVPTCAC